MEVNAFQLWAAMCASIAATYLALYSVAWLLRRFFRCGYGVRDGLE